MLQYPQWTGRRDRRGIPVYIFEVAHLNAKAVAANESSSSSKSSINLTSKVPPKMLRLFALYENLVNFALPLCSTLPDRPYPETPVSQSSNIVDISNVGLRQFWSLKNHMQDASQLATAHYPETLDRIFIIGAPSFFPTVWSWIKRWFDPITVSKIFIISNAEMKSTLEEYIDPENIPKKYGGKLDYKFGDLPNLDPSIQAALKWAAPEKLNGQNTFPTGPVKWQRYENGHLAAVAVGSENGKARDYKVATLTPGADVAMTSLGVNQGSHLYRTTTAVETHPSTTQGQADIPAPTYEDTAASSAPPVSGVSTAASTSGTAAAGGTFLNYHDLNLGSSTSNDGHAPETSRAGTSTLPYRDSAPVANHEEDDDAFQDAETHHPSTDRQGTSSTRYAEQSNTHAHGNVAEGTPHVKGTQGDTYGVMEPNTVGQAPKEHPVPPQEEPEAPSYLDQAKSLAGQAYGTAAAAGSSALAAVGVGAEKVEGNAEETETKKPEDPAVDAADPAKVEEFLRGQYKSPAAQEMERN